MKSKEANKFQKSLKIKGLVHLSEFEFHGFRYTLKTDAHDHSVWNDVTVSKAVRAVPSTLEDQPLFLSIDDTIGRTALTKQPIPMERKLSFICHWPGMA